MFHSSSFFKVNLREGWILVLQKKKPRGKLSEINFWKKTLQFRVAIEKSKNKLFLKRDLL